MRHLIGWLKERGEYVGLGVCLGALLACAGASSTRVGRDTFTIECKRSRANCYEEAAAVCPNGFEVLDGVERSGTYATANTVGNTTTVTAVPIYKGEMLVRCESRSAEADEVEQ
jgi:hypothetical protein